MRLKVKCIDAPEGWSIKVGSVYEVKRSFHDGFRDMYELHSIIGPNHGYENHYYASRFEIVGKCPCDIKGCLTHRNK